MLVTEIKLILLLAGYEKKQVKQAHAYLPYEEILYVRKGIATITGRFGRDLYSHDDLDRGMRMWIDFVDKGGANIISIDHLKRKLAYAET